MARASVRTLLPLDTWARIMGFHPLHFNGVSVDSMAPATTCGQPIMQYAWQAANAVSREDIANAIQDAESRIADYVRFKLLPTFEVDERHDWPRAAVPELFDTTLLSQMARGGAVRTDWGHVVAAGIQTRTLVVAAAAVAYTDTDGDGYAETARVTVATSITDPNELVVVVPNEGGAAEWEIRPVVTTMAGGTATITMRREQLLNPGITEGFGGRAVDGLDDTMFLATVDVYRVWHDPSQQIQFLWENTFGMCGCDSASCTTCYLSAQFGCSLVRDYRTGLMTASPAIWNSTTQAYEPVPLSVGRAPDRVRLWYRAGYRNQSAARPMLEMDSRWARAVAYFATALLARPLCACANITSAVELWQEDLAKNRIGQSSSETFQIDRASLGNPFGTTRGALYAWNVFRRQAIGEAVM